MPSICFMSRPGMVNKAMGVLFICHNGIKGKSSKNLMCYKYKLAYHAGATG